MLSSESCALGTVGAEYVREVLPGEVIRLDADGISSFLPLREGGRPPRAPAACVFEYVYFARPDSILEGQQARRGAEEEGERGELGRACLPACTASRRSPCPHSPRRCTT